MKKKIFIFTCYILVACFLTFKTFAYSSDPKEFITEVVNEAKKILVKANSIEFRTQKLSEIALQTVDIKGVGLYSLGRYKKQLSAEELEKYHALFKEYFLKSFTSRLADYSDPKIEVLSAEVLNSKYTMVKSLLLATEQKPEVKIDWRVYTKDPTNPLIRDLIIEGLSLAKTQKAEFSSIIESNNNDINKLFSELNDFVNKNN